jgi:rod shape-determining protein MreD
MRREILVALPTLGMAIILQTAVLSRMNLLSGCPDLVLLILVAWGLQERVRSAWIWGAAAGLLVGTVSAVPWYIYLASYLGAVAAARLLTRRIWQAPLLAMFAITFIGTLVMLMLTLLYRSILEVPLAFGQAFVQIVLPSVLLNLLLAIPVHGLIRDLSRRLYPAEAGL